MPFKRRSELQNILHVHLINDLTGVFSEYQWKSS